MALMTRGEQRDGRQVGPELDAVIRRNRELEALYSISATFNTEDDLRDGLRYALETVLEVLDFPSGVLRLLDPPTGDLLLAAHAGLSAELEGELSNPFRASDSPGGLSVQRRALVVIDDVAEGAYAASPWARHGYRTFVSAPLQCKGMLLGCLNMASERVRPLDARERELLTALANQVGMAAGNTELYRAAQRKIEQLSALHQCSQDVGPAPELERVLRLTTERMAQLLHLDRTAVFYRSPAADELMGAAAYGFGEEKIRALRCPLQMLPAAAAALREQQVWLSEDAGEEGLLPDEFTRRHGIGEALALPLVAHEQVIGLLVGERSGQPLRFTADEMDLAMIFANQASVWIASARLFVLEQEARAEAEAVQERFGRLLELAPDAIVVVSGAGRITLVNSQTERMFGYSRGELLGRPVEILMPERFRRGHTAHRARYVAEPRTRPMGAGLELLGRRKDGTEFPVEISLSPSRGGEDLAVTSVIRDITDRRQAALEREQLLASERQKSEQLKLAVREAHHRIKNNLQAISDLLYLELASDSGASAGELLRESVERIQSIALVHDLLSQDEDVQTVDMRAMAGRLVPMALRGAGLSETAAGLEMSVPSVPLSSKKATALALILNELVSNAAKHALSGRAGGRLQVTLKQADEGLLLLVCDNGAGLPPGFDLTRDANVGLQVVRTLAERDLGGKLTLSKGPGLSAGVWFPW
jgi:two-component system, sensor histidine kinase PdtaS